LLLQGQPWPARIWAALLLVPIPMAASWQVKLIENPDELPRMPLYLSSAVSLWLLAAVTFVVAIVSEPGTARLRLAGLPWAPTLGWAAACALAGVVGLVLARTLRIQESRILRRLLPVTRREKLAFAGLSLTAGVCEELVFRGFLLDALATTWRSPLLAVAVCSAVFGWMHAYQEAKGAIRAATLGAILAAPVVLTGSVIPSMIAHTTIDVVGGIFLQKRLVSAVE
jgi:membrane protease YdiL (CAAX protease family)